MLDRLVRRPVGPEADGVVRHHVDVGQSHQGGEPHRRPGVVREREESGDVWPDASVEDKSVRDGSHRVLADAPPQVAALGRVPGEVRRVDQRVVRARQVGASADEFGEAGSERGQSPAGGGPRGDRIVVGAESRQLLIPRRRQIGSDAAFEFRRELRVRRAVSLEALPPLRGERLAAGDLPAHVAPDGVRHEERRLGRPAVHGLGEPDLLLAQRRAVRGGRVLLVRGAVADVRANDDQGRAILHAPRPFKRCIERLQVVRVPDGLHVPPQRLESSAYVLGKGEIDVAIDRDPVVVVEPDELAESQVSGQRGGFVGDSLHEVAVAADDVRPVIDDRVARSIEHRREMRFGDRHPHGVRDALAERTGRRLDARDVAVLGVPRRAAPRSPEIADFLQGQVEPREVESGVLEDRRVAGGEHEPVPAEPGGVSRAVPHVAHPEGVRHGGKRHRGAGMTGAGSLDGVHGERPDRVDGLGFYERIRARSGGPVNGFGGPCLVQSPPRASLISPLAGPTPGSRRPRETTRAGRAASAERT